MKTFEGSLALKGRGEEKEEPECSKEPSKGVACYVAAARFVEPLCGRS